MGLDIYETTQAIGNLPVGVYLDSEVDDMYVGGHIRISYGGFAQWRRWLGAHVGIADMDRMWGSLDQMYLDSQGRLLETARARVCYWPESGNDSTLTKLVPLLAHSDCDGHLSPADLGLVVAGLCSLSPARSGPFDPDGSLFDWFQRFRDLCVVASDADHYLSFQ